MKFGEVVVPEGLFTGQELQRSIIAAGLTGLGSSGGVLVCFNLPPLGNYQCLVNCNFRTFIKGRIRTFVG